MTNIKISTTKVTSGNVISVTTDGGCRSNPGPGAWAFVVKKASGKPQVVENSGFLPYCTNNQAEYRALEAACLTLARWDHDEILGGILISSDSKLVVEQVNKRWKVKDEVLRPYFDTAYQAYQSLCIRTKVVLQWIPREQNLDADRLCNEEMDRRGIVSNKTKTGLTS